MRLARLAACGLLLLPAAAFAQDSSGDGSGSAPARKGNSVVQIGLFHVDTLDQADPLTSRILVAGQPLDFTSAGTSASVSSVDTLTFTYSYFATDHLALKFEGGIPAQFKFYGSGVVSPTGLPVIPGLPTPAVDLGEEDNNPLAKVTQWSPAVLLQYYFRNPNKSVRPYLGIGATYTWFTDIKVNQNFQDQLISRFGTVLGLANGDLSAKRVSANAADDFAPIFNAGVAAELSERWSVSGSISYTLLKTTATINIDSDAGNRLSSSQTKVDLNPLVIALVVGYRFDLPFLP